MKFMDEFEIEEKLSKETNYDYFGETLRDKLEPLLEELKDSAYVIRIGVFFYADALPYGNSLKSEIELKVDKNTHYDYIGESVRDEIEDLLIFAAKKYDRVCMSVRVIEL